MSTHQDTFQRLKDGPVDDSDTMTDEDLRQLIIHYATIIRDPNRTEDTVRAVIAAWNSWPQELFNRFSAMVAKCGADRNQKPFWCRPADTNNKYGIK